MVEFSILVNVSSKEWKQIAFTLFTKYNYFVIIYNLFLLLKSIFIQMYLKTHYFVFLLKYVIENILPKSAPSVIDFDSVLCLSIRSTFC